MTPRLRRILITVIVGSVALAIALTAMLTPRSTPSPAQPSPPSQQPSTPAVSEAPQQPPSDETVVASADGAMTEPVSAPALEGLHAVAPAEGESDPNVPAASLGSLNPNEAAMLVEFSRVGAGMASITLSNEWLTARAKHEADEHYAAVAAGDPNPPPLPDPSLRYLLKKQQPLHNVNVAVLAAHSVVVNGTSVDLFAEVSDEGLVPIWAETAPGEFHTEVVNDQDQALLRITRRFTLGHHGDLTLTQRIINLTDQSLDVQWRQFGPSDLLVDRARYLDRRRFRFGYLHNARLDPQRENVVSDDQNLILDRSEVFKRYQNDPSDFRLWPNERSDERGYELAWFGSTNRYFAMVVHPVLDAQGRGEKSLESIVEEIRFMPSTGSADTAVIFTYLHSPMLTLEPQSTAVLDMGLYAGPMDRHILGTYEPYASLGMQHIIVYMMSTFCAICTFQWLAHLLIFFLTFLKTYVLFDWGLAIIGLVVVVRGLLHPITKRSQINMMRFGKQMQAMKPEIDKLQKKYKDDPKKVQQEQLRLMREHGVNPFQMLGCLPMFLQMPVWIALYAMLYFAWDIRHQPAFFGLFQKIGNWPFLADLSTGDHFFGEFAEPILLFGFWNVTGINLLPILMGAVLFIHQKYMTPPPSATMTPEQMQQQRIMRVMIVGMMPIFLYNAPAGLTLYILTSSIIGIIESRYVRAHVDQMDLTPKPLGQTKKKKKIKDRQGRAYAEALERAKAKRAERNQRSYKKKRGR